MGVYWRASHCVYDCRYHIVWITKYRRKALNADIKKRLEIHLTELCNELYVKILKVGMEEDHVHLYVSIPVTQPLPYVVKTLKGKTSFLLRKEFKEYLKRFYWKTNALWAVGYFVATVGEVTHDTIKKYIEQQGKKDIEEECIELKESGIG